MRELSLVPVFLPASLIVVCSADTLSCWDWFVSLAFDAIIFIWGSGRINVLLPEDLMSEFGFSLLSCHGWRSLWKSLDRKWSVSSSWDTCRLLWREMSKEGHRRCLFRHQKRRKAGAILISQQLLRDPSFWWMKRCIFIHDLPHAILMSLVSASSAYLSRNPHVSSSGGRIEVVQLIASRLSKPRGIFDRCVGLHERWGSEKIHDLILSCHSRPWAEDHKNWNSRSSIASFALFVSDVIPFLRNAGDENEK